MLSNMTLNIESDSIGAVYWCSNIDSRPWELWEVFAKFDHLCSDVPELEISNICREANSMADAHAKTRVDREILFQAWLS
ncbi:hypothetical protein J1N35_011407 [Gossypium stocksii]|uniref:RNase H type-1 domain-containing protein n=1 Tax=Gossypium stocksii TaxID=47602 RepID=A0A9D4AD92_9ROSI|nr:hypothetical protein J1N35_011407 [Gossypium stocksii]